MKILVTGGAGNIGGYVVQALAEGGHEVVVLDRLVPQHRVEGVRYRVGDHEELGDIVALCQGKDAIVHLSAIPSPNTWPDTTVFRTNVMGTYNAHEAAVIAGVPLVVSTSSQSAYGFAYQFRSFMPHYLPMDEKHPDLSQDAYGLSKMVGEQIAHAYHRRCGLRVCSIRPPWVLLPEIYSVAFQRAVKKGESEWHGNVYAYVDVRDLATAFKAVVEAPAAVIQDEVFNVAADDALADEPLAELLPRLDARFSDMARSIVGSQSMISAEHLKRTLGWRAVHSWRDPITQQEGS